MVVLNADNFTARNPQVLVAFLIKNNGRAAKRDQQQDQRDRREVAAQRLTCGLMCRRARQ